MSVLLDITALIMMVALRCQAQIMKLMEMSVIQVFTVLKGPSIKFLVLLACILPLSGVHPKVAAPPVLVGSTVLIRDWVPHPASVTQVITVLAARFRALQWMEVRVMCVLLGITVRSEPVRRYRVLTERI